jgi:hypothetical protein
MIANASQSYTPNQPAGRISILKEAKETLEQARQNIERIILLKASDELHL